jgi:hypothetical protein
MESNFVSKAPVYNLILFVWLIRHQPAVLFSQNKPATSNPYFSLRTNQHQPPAKRTGCLTADFAASQHYPSLLVAKPGIFFIK